MAVTEEKTRLQKYAAPALEKGLDILELLSLASDHGLSQTEISDGLGRSKNEIFRMMVVLEERGYIERVDGDVFRMTEKISKLAAPISAAHRLLEIARPFMHALSEKTRMSNHLWVLDAGRMHVVSRSRASQSYSLALPEGAQSRLFGSSAGACFLSDFPNADARLQALRDMGELIAEDDYSNFDAAVEICKQRGACILPSIIDPDVVEVSAPIKLESNQKALGVITIPSLKTLDFNQKSDSIIDNIKYTVKNIVQKANLIQIPQY